MNETNGWGQKQTMLYNSTQTDMAVHRTLEWKWIKIISEVGEDSRFLFSSVLLFVYFSEKTVRSKYKSYISHPEGSYFSVTVFPFFSLVKGLFQLEKIINKRCKCALRVRLEFTAGPFPSLPWLLLLRRWMRRACVRYVPTDLQWELTMPQKALSVSAHGGMHRKKRISCSLGSAC